VSDVIRRNERQVWFIAEHVVNVPIIQATRGAYREQPQSVDQPPLATAALDTEGGEVESVTALPEARRIASFLSS
jgi:hypothetical protein